MSRAAACDGLGARSLTRRGPRPACAKHPWAAALVGIALWGCGPAAVQAPILREIQRGPIPLEPSSEHSTTPVIITPDDEEEHSEPASDSVSNAAGLAVLTAAAEMIENKVIVRGSCWDYANAVYERAGFDSKQLIKVFQ
ncbi:MAG: hypothetical protein RBU37_22435, partial [Myxococcota bacterium]|nr:hypothetical protein [Myxococcota bacterium]